ncbi:hypothetical protein [Streptomyces collinus]|uniref:hypothetical protein n=1 Tax=Streptomyces collinus TaxID=42684 RepID=UPI0029432013|nr:hypothetical protein [Streptomyces collinus]
MINYATAVEVEGGRYINGGCPLLRESLLGVKMTTSPAPGGGAPLPGGQDSDDSLVGLRTAVILVIGVFCGLVAGALTRLDGHSTAAALLAGASAAGLSIPVLHKLIGKN